MSAGKTDKRFFRLMRIRPHDRVQRFPDVRHTRFLTRSAAPEELEIQTEAEHRVHGNDRRMGTPHAGPAEG